MKSPRPSRLGGLRARAVILLLAAVLPAALVVLVVAYRAYVKAREAEIVGLAQDAELVGARLAALPASASRLASLLTVATGWDSDFDAQCSPRLASALRSYTGLESITFYRGGALVCRGRTAEAGEDVDFAADARFGPLLKRDAWEGLIGDGGGRRIAVGASASAAGSATVVVIDRSFLARVLAIYRSYPSSAAFLVDESGAIVAAARPEVEHRFAGLRGLPLGKEPGSAIMKTAAGDETVFTTRPLGALPVWLVTAQDSTEVFSPARDQFWLASSAPLLVLAAATLAIWLGLAHLVLRWVQHISKATRAYAQGDLAARVGPCEGAPREIGQLAQNFDSLSDAMAQRAAQLEREVAERQRFLKELHHRVKNTLQIIASMLALQRRLGPPEARTMLRAAEDRMNSVAAAYAVAYRESEPQPVPLDRLLADVGNRLLHNSSANGAAPRLVIGEAPQRIDLDTAITLAMLLAEILPPYVDEAARTGAAIGLRLESAGARWRFIVEGPAPQKAGRDTLSQRIVGAYLRQLDGAIDDSAPGRVVLDVAARDA